MVSNASWTVRIFSDWMSSCRVKNGCRVADSLEFCWYTTDLKKKTAGEVLEEQAYVVTQAAQPLGKRMMIIITAG